MIPNTEMTLLLSQRLHSQAYHSFDGSCVLLKPVTVMADVKLSGHKNNTNKNDQSLHGMPNPAWQQTLILILTVFPNNP